MPHPRITDLLLLCLYLPLGAIAMYMDRHLWRERLLFLIAPSADDPMAVRQREALNERADALNDRDLKIFSLFELSPSLFGNSQLSDREVRELCDRLKIDPGSKAKH